LIFDGAAFIAVNGQIAEESRRFVFTDDVTVTTSIIDVSALERARLEMGSWRQQSEQLNHGVYGDLPPIVHIDGVFESNVEPPAMSPYWQNATEPSLDPSLEHHVASGLIPQITWQDLPHLELEMALALGLQEYLNKCGIRKVALALSGGRDSTMCAVLLRRMVDYQNPTMTSDERREVLKNLFVTAYMGTENSGSATRNAAKSLADELGAIHYDGDIQAALETHLSVFQQMTGIEMTWAEEKFDLPLQNVQARLRGSLIWMVANVHNALLLTTSNKSEAAVGYTTMDGDTSGGLAPIADVPKSLVIEWLNWAAEFHAYESIALVSQMPSTAELRPQDSAQTDEDDLMPFVILDQLMYHFVQLGLEPLEICQRLWPTVQTHYGSKIQDFGTHIELFTKKLCFAQWKRERFAISFRVTSFDLDPKTGFRFPPVQAPFRVELAEMWEWINEQDC
jgi:NAD+ synthase (glutamine-hydrolysing)